MVHSSSENYVYLFQPTPVVLVKLATADQLYSLKNLQQAKTRPSADSLSAYTPWQPRSHYSQIKNVINSYLRVKKLVNEAYFQRPRVHDNIVLIEKEELAAI